MSTMESDSSQMTDRVEIRASTVLPAMRTDIELHTADGLRLVGELARPLDRPAVATMICLHPLPTHGGMMDSLIFRKAAWRLPALADIAVLRFNTRGTESPRGRSEGAFDNARSERFDVAAAIEYTEFEELPHPWLVGWSFGTDLALMYGCDPHVEGTILLSPPLRFSKPEHLESWARSKKPVAALVPEHDDYLRPAQARDKFSVIPQAEVVGIEGAKHLWVGDADRALNEIVKRMVPGSYPLPTMWDGPSESASMFAL